MNTTNNPFYNCPEVTELTLKTGLRVRISDEVLGKGATGKVMLGYMLQGEEAVPVAVKIMPIKDIDNLGEAGITDLELLRYRENGVRLAQIDHPNVIKIKAIALLKGGLSALGDEKVLSKNTGECLYVVQEYVKGNTLADMIAEHPNGLPITLAVHMATEVAKGLAKLHEHYLIHRDLKPENILIADDGDIKIGDFGNIKHLYGTKVTEKIMQKYNINSPFSGTPRYTSPEQAVSESTTNKSDMYSFGAILFEMMTGKSFVTPNVNGSGLANIVGTLLKHSNANTNIGLLFQEEDIYPMGLCNLVRDLTQLEPEKRPENMQNIINILSTLKYKHDLCEYDVPVKGCIWNEHITIEGSKRNNRTRNNTTKLDLGQSQIRY